MSGWFRDLPIGRKLVAVSVAASALALIVSGAVFLISSFLTVRDFARNDLSVQAQILASNTSAVLAFEDKADADTMLGVLRSHEAIDLGCLYDKNANLFASYSRPGTDASCPPVTPDQDAASGGARATVVAPVTYRGVKQGTALLQGNFDQVWDLLTPQTIAAVAGIIVGAIAAIVLTARIQRVVSRPIQQLSSTARSISEAGDYSLRAEREGTDEIGQLVDTFNAMVAEVERRDDQLRAANRLKDEFLAALSHELRTPLNAMLGWTQVLRTGKAAPDVVARAYESIERNARAQATLIEDLLDISRIVSGKLHLKSEAVDLTAVIEAALEVVRPAAEAKEITIVKTLAPSPQFINGDVDRLQQIAWNLLSNAVKFTPRGGRVEVALRTAGDTYAFDVRDNGAGIAADFLPHVFDRFRQADGSLTRRHGGLGLGLAIVRELVQLHGGQVRAESGGVGFGAAFMVELPRPAAAARPRPAAAGSPLARLDGVSVLLIDDDEDARQLASIVLSRAGADVVSVESAQAAWTVLEARRFDIVVSDLAMPGTDGYAFLDGLRAGGSPRARTPAIALTAHAGAGTEVRARESGFDSVVTKPYDIETLITAIRGVLAKT